MRINFNGLMSDANEIIDFCRAILDDKPITNVLKQAKRRVYNMADVFEVIMVIAFGVSWPASLLKSYRAKTTKGKSIFFLFMILTGYAAGITGKIIGNKTNYVVVFYAINFCMVFCDILLYFRNRRIDMAGSLAGGGENS